MRDGHPAAKLATGRQHPEVTTPRRRFFPVSLQGLTSDGRTCKCFRSSDATKIIFDFELEFADCLLSWVKDTHTECMSSTSEGCGR